MKRVTGLGGVFFKCKDPNALTEWYRKHLGILPRAGGECVFEWREKADSARTGCTVWGPFPSETAYFQPSQKEFMLNYRVENLEALLAELRVEGVQVVGEIQSYGYGKFGWIMDPEGNKIELWKPAGDTPGGADSP